MTNNYDPIEEQHRKIEEERNQRSQSNQNSVKFDAKNYLNVKLEKGENEKNLTIRIINSPDGTTSPFTEIYTHYVPALKKNYVCSKLTNDLPSDNPRTCPFCDIKDEARANQKGADPVLWEKLKKIQKDHSANKNFVVRVIDRDDESFGVKFWKFSQPAYDSIFEIYKKYKKHNINIFDSKSGYDLEITIKRSDNKAKIASIIPAVQSSPVADTDQRIIELLQDPKVWSDVYKAKPYEYLELIIQGKTPYFNKEKGIWVEKEERGDQSDSGPQEDYENDNFYEAANETANYADSDDLPF